MSEWRVVKHDERGFEVQRKGWVFWDSCHRASMGIGSMPVFQSLDEAKRYIMAQKSPPRVVHEE